MENDGKTLIPKRYKIQKNRDTAETTENSLRNTAFVSLKMSILKLIIKQIENTCTMLTNRPTKFCSLECHRISTDNGIIIQIFPKLRLNNEFLIPIRKIINVRKRFTRIAMLPFITEKPNPNIICNVVKIAICFNNFILSSVH